MDQIFELTNLAVLPFWLLMIAAPRWRVTRRLLAGPWGLIAPTLAYVALVVPRLPEILPAVARPELGAIAALLGTPAGATIAWAHFLAFDLFVGRFIYLDATERGMSRWVLAPILLLTLLMGPLGLLTYGLVIGARRVPTGGLHRPLVLLALASAGLLVVSLGLMLIDGRQVLGASIWLKPAKFAASVGLTSFTLALLLRQMAPLGRGVRAAVAVAIGVFVLELAIITLQSARGVASHFNVATATDTVLFAIMGLAIAIATLALGYVGWRSFRQRFSSPAQGWGIRLGFLVMLIGASLGGLMPRPTDEQLRDRQAGERISVVGAHAVGVPDGGPGLPVTRWSTDGGDLRIPHFLGLHALQLLPLAGWWLGRRHRGAAAGVAARRTVVIGAGYLGLIAATLVQALRGQPLVAPDAATVASLALVLVGTGVGWWLVARQSPRPVVEGAAVAVSR